MKRGAILLMSFSIVAGGGEEGAEVACLPERIASGHFSALRQHSPFTRTLNASESLILTGVATVNGSPVFTLLDTESMLTHVISESPNARGWKMVEGSKTDRLESAVALVSVEGGEIVRVTYDEAKQKEVARKRPKVATSARGITVENTAGKLSHYRQGEERDKYYAALREKHAALSEEQRNRVREIMGEKYRENPQMTPRDRGTLYLKVMDHVLAGGK